MLVFDHVEFFLLFAGLRFVVGLTFSFPTELIILFWKLVVPIEFTSIHCW